MTGRKGAKATDLTFVDCQRVVTRPAAMAVARLTHNYGNLLFTVSQKGPSARSPSYAPIMPNMPSLALPSHVDGNVFNDHPDKLVGTVNHRKTVNVLQFHDSGDLLLFGFGAHWSGLIL